MRKNKIEIEAFLIVLVIIAIIVLNAWVILTTDRKDGQTIEYQELIFEIPEDFRKVDMNKTATKELLGEEGLKVSKEMGIEYYINKSGAMISVFSLEEEETEITEADVKEYADKLEQDISEKEIIRTFNTKKAELIKIKGGLAAKILITYVYYQPNESKISDFTTETTDLLVYMPVFEKEEGKRGWIITYRAAGNSDLEKAFEESADSCRIKK